MSFVAIEAFRSEEESCRIKTVKQKATLFVVLLNYWSYGFLDILIKKMLMPLPCYTPTTTKQALYLILLFICRLGANKTICSNQSCTIEWISLEIFATLGNAYSQRSFEGYSFQTL